MIENFVTHGGPNPDIQPLRLERSRELALLIAYGWLATASAVYSVQMNSLNPWPFYSFVLIQTSLAFDLIALTAVARGRFVQRLLLPLALMLSTLTALPLSIGVPDRFFGYDSHLNYASTISVSEFGWNPGAFPAYFPLQGVTPWPAMDMLAVALASAGGLSFVEVARFLPLVLSLTGLLGLYAAVKSLFGNKVALYSITAIGASYLWISTNDVYVRNSIGTALFWPLVFVLFQAVSKKSARYLGLFFLIGITIVFAHSLTSLMLVLVFGLLALQKPIQRILRRLSKWQRLTRLDLKRFVGMADSAQVMGVATVVVLLVVTYWTYVYNGPLQVFGNLLQELSSGYQLSRPVYLPRALNARQYLSLAGTFGFLLISIGEILRRTLLHPDLAARKRTYGLTGGLIFAVGEGSTLFHTLYLDTFRFVGFAWPFLIPATLREDRKRAAGISRLSLGLLACFVAFNLVIIPPASIDHTSLPDYSAGEYRLYFYPSEYAAIALIPPGTRVAGDQAIWHLMSSYRPDSTVNVDLKLFGGDPADLQAYDYFVVRNEDFGIVFSATAKLPATTVTNQTYGSLLANQNLCLVYANGSVQIFKVTKNT